MKLHNRIKYFIILLFLVSLVSSSWALDIKTEFIAKIPSDIASDLIGMRVYKDSAFVMASNGKYVTINLANGNITNHSLNTNKVLDYDVVVGKIIYLDENGMICGHAFPKWPKGPYRDSCFIEACDQGAILSGGNNAHFLGRNATTTVDLPEISFALPINNGFIWSLNLGKEKLWEANLYDCFGNLMGKVYKFSEYFEPSNIEIGPSGIDGELLVSATEDNVRTLALIGNNGRMFWKINGPKKVCNRDVAFGLRDDLIVLDRNSNGEIILSRWTFSTPEGYFRIRS